MSSKEKSETERTPTVIYKILSSECKRFSSILFLKTKWWLHRTYPNFSNKIHLFGLRITLACSKRQDKEKLSKGKYQNMHILEKEVLLYLGWVWPLDELLL